MLILISIFITILLSYFSINYLIHKFSENKECTSFKNTLKKTFSIRFVFLFFLFHGFLTTSAFLQGSFFALSSKDNISKMVIEKTQNITYKTCMSKLNNSEKFCSKISKKEAKINLEKDSVKADIVDALNKKESIKEKVKKAINNESLFTPDTEIKVPHSNVSSEPKQSVRERLKNSYDGIMGKEEEEEKKPIIEKLKTFLD